MKTVEEKAERYANGMYQDAKEWDAWYDGYMGGYNEAMRCQSSPKIKQLEWNFYGTYYSAETPAADYMITQENDFNINENECVLWIDEFQSNFETLEDAKAAAQADFEKRVMECLDIADNSNK